VLVSETVWEAACDAFSFRRIDRVAVKGKTQGIDVYELLGPAGTEASPHVQDYERAFDAYLELDFDTAIAILDAHPDDAPSAVLAARCREYAKSPPPAEWNRVHVARVK
jgi:adenylate cyclase